MASVYSVFAKSCPFLLRVLACIVYAENAKGRPIISENALSSPEADLRFMVRYRRRIQGVTMSEDTRKYEFSWSLVQPATDEPYRPNLGDATSLQMYRLFQFTMRDILEQQYGTEAADDIFRSAGTMAGRAFFEHYCKDAKDVSDLANIIQEKFREFSIGIVRFEEVDLVNMSITLTVDEDLDCSGLPDTQEQICVYDEGLIKGILEAFTGKEFSVREIDCWCTGERTCRFRADLVPAAAE